MAVTKTEYIYISLIQCSTTEFTSITRKTNEEKIFNRLQINSVHSLM
jgi:hypothetical protein